MAKKKIGLPPPLEWNPNEKEPWHLDFEKEYVNDKRWTCLVTTAVPDEAQDEEFIQIFTNCASTGIRKAITVLTMADVIKLLKESGGGGGEKKEGKKKDEKMSKKEKSVKPAEEETEGLKPPPPRSSEIVALAAFYATFVDDQCKLPPDLMAGVLKYLILNLKDQHCFWKRVARTKARLQRQKEVKARFIRDMKPYETDLREGEDTKNGEFASYETLYGRGPIEDEPLGGPDLYVVLTDFYDLSCFPELIRINVPFVALLKVSHSLEDQNLPVKTGTAFKKESLLAEFWEKLKENCSLSEKTPAFKHIAMLQYEVPMFKNLELKNFVNIIFDELSWTQYSIYYIYRQHQRYLRELYVQSVTMSLEPLDLSKCEVYNSLCDALVSGEPITPCLILYAMTEQVAAGVPATRMERLGQKYEPRSSNFFSFGGSEVFHVKSSFTSFPDKRLKVYEKFPPCENCRGKQRARGDPCDHRKESLLGKNDGTASTTTVTGTENSFPLTSSLNLSEEPDVHPDEVKYSASFIAQVISERKTEKECRRDKKWKNPSLIFHGDSLLLQTFHCDRRLLDPEDIFLRYFKNPTLRRFWARYPELPPNRRAFYNYHFFSLWKISEEAQDALKLKIFFTLCMKLIGTINSYLYRGKEETLSEMLLAKEHIKKPSRVRFDQDPSIPRQWRNSMNFPNYFLKTFIGEIYLRRPRKTVPKMENAEMFGEPAEKLNLFSLRNQNSQLGTYMTKTTRRNSGTCYCSRVFEIDIEGSVGSQYANKMLGSLFNILDCFEISFLIEPNFLQDNQANLIRDFTFFEELEPSQMVHQLLESEESYNTIQTSYFAPTDTLFVIAHNDFDHRGVFCTYGYGALHTPVCLRDFYIYVYPEIRDWLIEEEAEYMRFIKDLEEQAKELKEKEEEEYLQDIKRKYCEMDEEERWKFLESTVQEESELKEENLDVLPIKPQFRQPNKTSFLTTNFSDVRTEVKSSVKEYHSQDNTEVDVVLDSWLYQSLSRLAVEVKRSNMKLCHTQILGNDEIDTTFTLKTTSGIIFVFYKDETKENFNYRIQISWPVGLIIEGIPHSSMYVKQGYIKIYRRGWDIEEEKFRCYLKNGHILIFKENDDVDILTSNGTIYTLYDFKRPDKKNSESIQILFGKCEMRTSCGEIWETITKGPCRNKKKLISIQKMYIGKDPKTQEIFYRRDDGVQSMLWPNGKLVTKYPDGTKITSTPGFNQEEVFTEWSEEEKVYYLKLEMSALSDQPKSRTILRNSSSIKRITEKAFEMEGFVSVSCSFLMEHPKYSTVIFTPKEPFIELKMPQMLNVKMYPEGNYQVTQEKTVIDVQGSTATLHTDCSICYGKSIATLYLNSNDILINFVDLFKKQLVVQRNGEMTIADLAEKENDDENVDYKLKQPKNTSTPDHECEIIKNTGGAERCFILNRDLSGMEFLRAGSVAEYCYYLPETTYYDLNCPRKDSTLSHTFSSSLHAVGYETWVMKYEDKNDSLPTNLKRKDLKEIGVKDRKKFYKELLPKCKTNQSNNPTREKVEMPKVILTRILKSFSQEPTSVIDCLKRYVDIYQKRAQNICDEYKKHTAIEDPCQSTQTTKMRLRKIALTLNQSLNMYPHLCTQFPSTEKEIHYFGHFIKLMDVFKSKFKNEMDYLPQCKQIPRRLPEKTEYPSIYEENEFLEDVSQ